jgi:hypothetical protein
MRVEYPGGNDALTEFILFFDRVYAYRSARWPASLDLNLPLVTGQSADCQEFVWQMDPDRKSHFQAAQ